MNQRRLFLRMLPAAAPAAVAAVAMEKAQADDGGDKAFLGSWNVMATVVANGFKFREFLSFAEGGVVNETNTFLHTASHLSFVPFGVNVVANASDGFGNWTRTGPRTAKAVFRKLMFDATTGNNFGDLRVSGTITSNGDQFSGEFHVEIVDAAGGVLANLGTVLSVGTRLT